QCGVNPGKQLRIGFVGGLGGETAQVFELLCCQFDAELLVHFSDGGGHAVLIWLWFSTRKHKCFGITFTNQCDTAVVVELDDGGNPNGLAVWHDNSLSDPGRSSPIR